MQITYFTQCPHPVSIIVIGCGGTGSLLLQSLGRIHSALLAQGHNGLHVTAYDGDTISASNIGRQLFSASEVGQNKAVTLITNINRFYGTYWTAVPYHFNEECHTSNIIISAVDNWKTRKEINEWYKLISYQAASMGDRYKPYLWMDLGNGKDFGQGIIGGIFKAGKDTIKLPTIIDQYPNEVEDTDSPSCSLAEALLKQDLFINQSMAMTASEILYRFLLTGNLETVAFYLNLQTFKTNLVTYEQYTATNALRASKGAATSSRRTLQAAS